MYITICEIDDQSKFNAGHSKPGHWDNPEGWDGGGGEGINGIKKIEIPIEIAALLWYIYTVETYSAI